VPSGIHVPLLHSKVSRWLLPLHAGSPDVAHGHPSVPMAPVPPFVAHASLLPASLLPEPSTPASIAASPASPGLPLEAPPLPELGPPASPPELDPLPPSTAIGASLSARPSLAAT